MDRFCAEVGDQAELSKTITKTGPATQRSRSKVEVLKANGELAVAGEHLMKWLP